MYSEAPSFILFFCYMYSYFKCTYISEKCVRYKILLALYYKPRKPEYVYNRKMKYCFRLPISYMRVYSDWPLYSMLPIVSPRFQAEITMIRWLPFISPKKICQKEKKTEKTNSQKGAFVRKSIVRIECLSKKCSENRVR